MKIVVLGGGLVGGAMALDLAGDPEFEVTVVDLDEDRLAALTARSPVEGLIADLADPAVVKELVAPYDLVVGAVPGHLGFQTLEAVIGAGRDVVDIAFFPEDPFELDEQARDAGVTAVVDCGVFPGMGSALLGRLHRKLDRLDSVRVYVGGLPVVRRLPWEYGMVFSPTDVIEEYIRPARMVLGGEVVTRPALSDVEEVNLPGIGTLEAFNTDGLRTLLTTIDAPFMVEKTLRYPGHAAKMALLRDAGFFAEEPVEVAGQKVRPVDLAGKLLFPAWELPPGEGDLTVMRILVDGVLNGQGIKYTYDLLDHMDHAGGFSSMARTTGFTATMTARLVATGRYRHPGISPPEFLGRKKGCVDYLLEGLSARGVVYQERAEVHP